MTAISFVTINNISHFDLDLKQMKFFNNRYDVALIANKFVTDLTTDKYCMYVNLYSTPIQIALI